MLECRTQVQSWKKETLCSKCAPLNCMLCMISYCDSDRRKESPPSEGSVAALAKIQTHTHTNIIICSTTSSKIINIIANKKKV